MIQIEIDRIHISLHGISSEMAEEAIGNLEGELVRKLGNRSISGLTEREISYISLGPINNETVLDPGSLRGMIADRLLEALLPSEFNSIANADL